MSRPAWTRIRLGAGADWVDEDHRLTAVELREERIEHGIVDEISLVPDAHADTRRTAWAGGGATCDQAERRPIWMSGTAASWADEAQPQPGAAESDGLPRSGSLAVYL